MTTVKDAADRVPAPTVQDLGNGFYTYVQLDGSWGLNNCGIFVGRTGALLVDTVFTVSRARALSKTLAGLTDKRVHTIVNTHHHGDHTYGNFAFPDAVVIGHQRCREAVLATGLETTKWFPGVDFGEIRVMPPFVTFQDSLTVYCDDYRVELRATEAPAHTNNDITAWVEELGLLFAGDLVFHGGTPFVVMGSIEGLKRSLRSLQEYGASTIVPGHGTLCGPEVIRDQLDYLEFVQDLARTSFDAGVPPLEAAHAADLGRFAEWTDSERLVGNLHRAYSELRGEALGTPLDYDAIVDEMVSFNDGRPLRCLA
ncbi:MAG: MBL fold metallo-hydrolase [Pseudonocardiaceae bacterium]|nr:MBL fold metallo-hydrolase [Pseudonocardiaceae bacterium]